MVNILKILPILLYALALSRPVHADPVTATITYPVNGAVNANLSQPIQWTTVVGAQAYELFLGTTPGARNLVDFGQTPLTSYVAAGLPTGQTIYSRIWVQVGGTWRYTDSTFSVAPLTATLTFPLNGAANANLLQPVQWTPVVAAQAYVLWVGTSVGAKNLVNTIEMPQTSYLAAGLPASQTLYARIWAQVGGTWRYTDSTFTVGPQTATLTFPLNGATNANLLQPVQWTPVVAAQAYVLWIGTSVGAKNLVNTAEMPQTSYLATGLPASQTLYARIYVQVGGTWRYTDGTFSAASQMATLTFPANGATNANLTLPIQWTAVVGAQAYELFLGTTVGGTNLGDSGQTAQTSYLATNLPPGQTIYARIYAQVGDTWRYTDSMFSAATLTATLTYPANGGTNVDDAVPATWGSVVAAQAYRLFVGSTAGAWDFVESSESLETSLPISDLPPGRLLYARLWTKTADQWRHTDSTFTVGPNVAEFVYPLDGNTGVDAGQPFRWTAALHAEGYKMWVGSAPGSNDLFDTGEVVGTSAAVTGLPSTGTLYARVWTKLASDWVRHSDIAFTLNSSTAPSTILGPVDGSTNFDTGRPFQWSPVVLARRYRLTIGTTSGGTDLHDSGEIRVTQRFVPGLPVGVPLFGRLQTKIGGLWYATDFGFSVAANTVSATHQIKAALWATNFVRTMAFDADNRPAGGTKLWDNIWPKYNAICTDFSATLLQILGEINLAFPARRVDVVFNTNHFDQHTLVEMFNSSTGAWMLLDPTFDLSVKRLSGEWATAEDLSAATLASGWTSVSYVLLGASGDFYARNYYLDYPLLFANVYHQGDPFVLGGGNSPLPYLQELTMPETSTGRFYAVRCPASGSTDVVVDGTVRTVTCDGIDSLSKLIWASSIAAPAASPVSFRLYLSRRFVF